MKLRIKEGKAKRRKVFELTFDLLPNLNLTKKKKRKNPSCQEIRAKRSQKYGDCD